MESWCVKEKRKTGCVAPSGHKIAQNGVKYFFCHCASCGIEKTSFVKKKSRKLSQPVKGAGFGELALTGFTHAIPWMAKKQLKWAVMGQVNC